MRAARRIGLKSFDEKLNRIYALAPKGIALGLERVAAAANLLGHPERTFFSVQVAGTNGKGTVSTLLSYGLVSAGVRTGLYTSPHLHRFTERIRIGGQEIDEQVADEELGRVLQLSGDNPGLSLTFFEVATLTAALVFCRQGVEIAVMEVGLGGRLDATSICDPGLSILTSVGWDHTDYLGDTLEAIAAEKAAVARPDRPFLVGRLPEPAQEVVEGCARARRGRMRQLGRDFHPDPALAAPWPGRHQRDNLALACEALDELGRAGWQVSRSDLLEKLAQVVLPGRFEKVAHPQKGAFVLDGAHNLEATLALIDALEEAEIAPAACIFGALRGKPAEAMLEALRPRVGTVFHVAPKLDRARPPEELCAPGELCCQSMDRAVEEARGLAGDGVVLVTGSFYTVSQARQCLLGEDTEPAVGL